MSVCKTAIKQRHRFLFAFASARVYVYLWIITRLYNYCSESCTRVSYITATCVHIFSPSVPANTAEYSSRNNISRPMQFAELRSRILGSRRIWHRNRRQVSAPITRLKMKTIEEGPNGGSNVRAAADSSALAATSFIGKSEQMKEEEEESEPSQPGTGRSTTYIGAHTVYDITVRAHTCKFVRASRFACTCACTSMHSRTEIPCGGA